MPPGDIYMSTIGTRVFQRSFHTQREPLAGALFLHGLGEHGGRHERSLALFAHHGIHCRTFDWPGHGKTEGRRGYIDSMETITTLIGEQMAMLRETLGPDKQIGLLGHSMGGFLALYHLALYPDIADFAWITSPLIDPEANASWLKRQFVQLINRVCPTFTVRSGIRATQCRHGSKKRADPLMHSLISVRLGTLLVEAAHELQTHVSEINPSLRLLMTHGGADVVCPPSLSRAFFERLPNEHRTYRILPGLLHEPFLDTGFEAFYEVLERWISDDLIPSLTRLSQAKCSI